MQRCTDNYFPEMNNIQIISYFTDIPNPLRNVKDNEEKKKDKIQVSNVRLVDACAMSYP